MEFREFIAGNNDNDRRIDKIVRVFIKDISLSEIYKAIRKGLIKINGKKCKPETHVFENDKITIANFLISKKTDDNGNTDYKEDNFNIVFKNEHLMIINKPYDVSVHGNDSSLDKFVVSYYKNNVTDKSISFTPGPLHRLDRKTTGLLAFSFSLDGARWFSENIQNHSIHKTYYAVLEGTLKDIVTWEDMITPLDDTKGFKNVVASDSVINEKSKKAITTVYPIQDGNFDGHSVTFVKITIKTGRKHQIRSQSSLHGHPLLGDTAYHGHSIHHLKRDFYLHAGELYFPDNNLGIPSVLKAPLDDDFYNFLNYCGIEKIDI